MSEMIKKTVLTFFLVIAGTTISSAVFILIFYPSAELSVLFLWQIVMMSFVTALGNFIFFSRREIGKRQMKYRMLCHYLFINAVVFATAILCGWMNIRAIGQAIAMFCLISVVYLAVLLVNIHKESETAEALNRRLSRLHKEEEDES